MTDKAKPSDRPFRPEEATIEELHAAIRSGETTCVAVVQQPGLPNDLRPETLYGPNAGLTEVLVPAGYVTTAYDPVFALTPDGTRYVPAPSSTPTRLLEPGLPFSLVFRAEPGREDVVLRVASAYEAASRRRIPPPAFGPLPARAAGRAAERSRT